MHYEHGKDVGGSRIVVEWTRSREVSYYILHVNILRMNIRMETTIFSA